MRRTDRDHLDPDPPRLIDDGFLDERIPQHPHYQPKRVGGCWLTLAALLVAAWWAA